ncbi:hypothetical protein BP5796_12036 [Coleophoma crateriformis]|uniref:Transcription factor domain-containing protein n=1 Tax=Coleophoma crateriformis TaxID=565419 RepID=A0A3D8QB94_9HELO|nr:hypothetical protein BP5796_12036 [Coleophoma crateriformis]
MLKITPEEQRYFEWFHHCSMTKLPGVFDSRFWSTLVLQASSKEPAVLHAVLALGAVHRREVLDVERPRGRRDVFDKQEQFMLRQYSKAISGLQPHFVAQNKESWRVTLIACLIFVFFEYLRGHYQAGGIHLQNGLRLADHCKSILKLSDDPIDKSIMEAFVRLQLQVQMFGQITEHIHSVSQGSHLYCPTIKFCTLSEARQQLDCLLQRSIDLTHLYHQTAVYSGDSPSPELLKAQSQIRVQLGDWFQTLKASEMDLDVHTDARAHFPYRFLSLYHTMAHIMVETCLDTARESIYDNFTTNFVSIITQAVDIYKILISTPADLFPSHSTADIGWIPPLYYTALKCRVHRIRVHAVKILSSSSHKEGIWDSKLAESVVREAIEIEEGEFYQDCRIDDDFPISEVPEAHDLTLPVLPDCYRTSDVTVVLPNNPSEKVELVCRRQGGDGNWESISRRLDASL